MKCISKAGRYVLLLAAAAWLSGCSSQPGEKEFRTGVKLFKQGHDVRARAAFEKSLSKRPAENAENAEAYNYLGVIYWRLGQLEQAITAFEDSMRLNPALMEPLYNLAQLYRENDRGKALELLKEAGHINQDDTRPLELLAEMYMEEDRWPEARKNLHEARSRAPESPRVLTSLAVSELHSEGPAAAQTYLMQALEFNADYAPALFNLGVIFDEWLKDPRQARSYYDLYVKKADENDPQLKKAQTALRRLAMNMADVEAPPSGPRGTQDEVFTPQPPPVEPGEIKALLKKAKGLALEGEVEKVMALCRRAAAQAEAAGDQARQRKALETMVELCFDQGSAFFELGVFNEKAGLINEARSNFNQAMTLDPSNITYFLASARTASKLDDHEAALILVKRAVNAEPDNPDALWQLAELYQKIEFSEEALAAYYDFERKFPGDSRVVLMRKRLEDLKTAGTSVPETSPPEPAPEPEPEPEVALQKELSFTIPNIRSRKLAVQAYNRGTVFHKRGDWDRAAELYTMAIEKDDTFVDAFYNLGLVYQKKGEPYLADDAFGYVLDLAAGSDDEVQARYRKGLIQYELKNDAKAVSELQWAVKLNPQHAKSHYMLGLIYSLAPATLDKAKQHYARFIELSPQDPLAARAQSWVESH